MLARPCRDLRPCTLDRSSRRRTPRATTKASVNWCAAGTIRRRRKAREQSKPRRTSHAGHDAARPVPSRARLHTHETGKTASKPVVGKAAKDPADSGPDKTSADAEAAGQEAGTAPLQDHLPLLIALHDISRFSAARASGNGPATNEQTEQPALDGETVPAQTPPLSLKKFRAASGPDNSLDTTPRPERAKAGADVSAQDPGQKLADDRTPVRRAAAPGWRDASSADGPAGKRRFGPEAKRSAPSMKAVDGAHSAASSTPEKQAPSAGRVDIVAEQSFPAPAQSPMNQTTSALIDALASENGLRQAFSTPSTSRPDGRFCCRSDTYIEDRASPGRARHGHGQPPARRGTTFDRIEARNP